MPEADRLKVFISYSRRDCLDFADQLDAALQACGFETLIDRHRIEGGENWQDRLGALISEADTVVFVLSPESAESEICAWEVERASDFAKRILPVIALPLGGKSPPQHLQNLNYIHFFDEPSVPGSGFGSGLARLVKALNADLDWLREHTRLLSLATAWISRGRPENRLLTGSDIAEAKAWLARKPRSAPDPTAAQLDFLHASEAAEIARADAAKLQLEERERLLRQAEVAARDREAAARRAEEAAKQAEAAQEDRREALAAAEVAIKGRARSQRRFGIILGLTTVALLALFGGLLFQLRETERREAASFASAAQIAIAEDRYEKAMRLALMAVPPEGAGPWSLSWEEPSIRRLEATLASAAHMSRRLLTIYVKDINLCPEKGAPASFSVDAKGVTINGSPQAVAEQDRPILARLAERRGASATPAGQAALAGQAEFVNRKFSLSDREMVVVIEDLEEAAVSLMGHEGAITGVDFSPDGTMAGTVSKDGSARIWLTKTGKQVFIAREEPPFDCISFSADGRFVGLARRSQAGNSYLNIIDVSPHRELLGSSGYFIELRNSDRVLEVQADGLLMRERATLREVAVLPLKDAAAVTEAILSPDGRRLALVSKSGVQVWQREAAEVAGAGKERERWSAMLLENLAAAQLSWGKSGQEQAQRAVEFTADSRRLAIHITSGGYLWHIEEDRQLEYVARGKASEYATSLDVAGERIRIHSREISIWRLVVGDLRFSPNVRRTVTSTDRTRIVMQASNAFLLWDATANEQLAELKGPMGLRTYGAGFSPSGRRIVALFENALSIWDAATGTHVATFPSSITELGIVRALFMDEARVLVLADSDEAYIFDVTWAGKLRGPELRDRACAERLSGSKLITIPELMDPMLARIDRADLASRAPCARRGPMSREYWLYRAQVAWNQVQSAWRRIRRLVSSGT